MQYCVLLGPSSFWKRQPMINQTYKGPSFFAFGFSCDVARITDLFNPYCLLFYMQWFASFSIQRGTTHFLLQLITLLAKRLIKVCWVDSFCIYEALILVPSNTVWSYSFSCIYICLIRIKIIIILYYSVSCFRVLDNENHEYFFFCSSWIINGFFPQSNVSFILLCT